MATGDDGDDRPEAPALVRVVPERRVVRLRKQHSALVAKVRQKRNAIARLQAEAEPIARELSGRAAALRAEHRDDDERIHVAFEAIRRDAQLRRSDRSAARVLYQHLQSAGAISERAIDPRDATDPPPPIPSAELQRAATMRPTFLRLASEYHPDKTTDDALRVQRTEIMKDINHAYRGGDVSRLLELERTLGDGESLAEQLAPAALEAQVAALRAQLRELSREMSQLRTGYEGAIAIEVRRLTRSGCADPIAALIDDLGRAAAQTLAVLELVQRFHDGDIDIDTLFDGPTSDPGDDGQWLAEVFAMARQSIATRPRDKRSNRRRPR